ncbi:MAG: methylenetetrahydrofolate reductase [Oscillospiraceae bacterium]|nr:methylenetetrahydrofolate reductase [Oscillospiraceae bacterium]
MKISQLYNKGKTVFAIEVFPPKKGSAMPEKIYAALEEIAGLNPDYISVTCGAGGSDSQGGSPTVQVASFLKNVCKVEPVAHLTCVASDKQEVSDLLAQLKIHRVENILALRGDINPDIRRKHDFIYAADLVRFIREQGHWEVAGACYPEGHSEADCLETDLKHLKIKTDAGCSTLITQVFFDNALLYSFLDKARETGIDVPVSAGIIAVTSKKQIERMVSMCGASLPPQLTKMIAKYETRPDALRDAGIDYATRQIADLIEQGVQGIHFYAMNSPYVARKIHDNIKDLL